MASITFVMLCLELTCKAINRNPRKADPEREVVEINNSEGVYADTHFNCLIIATSKG